MTTMGQITQAAAAAAPALRTLSDDDINRMIDDPALIETHEQALEVMAVLDAEIAAINSQVETCQTMYFGRPLPPEKEAWVRRATYASAMRRNDWNKVYKRDKELRGLKSVQRVSLRVAEQPERIARQQRFQAEAEDRKAKRAAEHDALRLRQAEASNKANELKIRRSFNHHFHQAAKDILAPELYEQVKGVADGAVAAQQARETPAR